MNKTFSYLKMNTPADLLAVQFFASTGQLKGKFVQEIDPPWTIWWQPQEDQSLLGRIGTMIKGELPQPDTVWKPGMPNGKCKNISWLDLFRKAVIKPETSRRVSSEVVMVTPDKEVFYSTVKNHFVLQQGKIEFAVFESGREYFLLKIIDPSLWVFNTLKGENWSWYNLIPGQSGIYVEAGWYIHDVSKESCLNRFQIAGDGILLVQKDGRLLTLNPRWQKGDSIIRVEFSNVSIKQKKKEERISVVPVLRKSDARVLDTLWKISDARQFKAILINESLEKFRNYRLVICKDHTIWVHAVGKHADRSLATVLSDAFTSYVEMTDFVFVPRGRILAPALSSERLHKIIGGRVSDFIVIEEGDDGLRPLIIERQDWSVVEDFITLQAEIAARKAEAQKSGWTFEFKDLKKKKEVVEIEVKTAVFEKIKAVSENGQVGTAVAVAKAKKKRARTIDLSNVPELGKSEISELRLELEQIDRRLLHNVADHQLWKDRYMVCLRMRLRVSALASLMVSALLSHDDRLFAECIHEFAALKPEFAVLTHENINEMEKGNLLAAIRRESVYCEFNYGLLMAYAAKFNDSDIFFQAITAMKNAFPGEKREFYGFNEIRVASGGGMNVENRVELLTENDIPRIRLNVNKFLLQAGCVANIRCIALVRKQLHKVLSFHLSRNAANDLVPLIDPKRIDLYEYRNKDDIQQPGHLNIVQYFYDKIERWPESLEDKNFSPAVARWLKLLVMDKVKETPLRDFFTGDLYKPPFDFFRANENRRNGLQSIKWIKELGMDQFPEKSDGRPIARAIYYRFSENSNDWKDYFEKAVRSNETEAIAKTQRLLLLMVSEFGPHPVFAKYIAKPEIMPSSGTTTDIYDLTMYCDMFRLCLAYKKPVDEQRLFNMLINRIPHPPDGWEAFRSSAEWIILCLLLTSSPARRFQLDNLIVRSMKWLNTGLQDNNKDMVAEALTVLCFLSIGILADLVPEKLELHQLLEKRKVIWMEHAFAKSAGGAKAFEQWQQDCWF